MGQEEDSDNDPSEISAPNVDDWRGMSGTLPIAVNPIGAGSTQPCLVVISGAQMGQVFRLSKEAQVIGRGETARFRVRDPSISREHVEVKDAGSEGVLVRDLRSTNGTFLNGKRIEGVHLSEGDRLQVGKATILKLEYHGRVENEFHEQLYDAGTRDPLTGLFNRRYFDQHLDADVRLCLRHEEVLSVCLIDVDHFKLVNDGHGHLAGDNVLRTLADVMGQRVRAEDILARYGGEEFVLLVRRTGRKGAIEAAESIRARVEDATFSYQGVRIPITVSVGVTTLDGQKNQITSRMLLQVADKALYSAKSGGRNRVEYLEVD